MSPHPSSLSPLPSNGQSKPHPQPQLRIYKNATSPEASIIITEHPTVVAEPSCLSVFLSDGFSYGVCNIVFKVIYIVMSPSSSLLRASQVRFSSTTGSFPPSIARTPASSFAFSRSSVLFVNPKHRSLSFSSAHLSLTCSAPRWSDGLNWRSPLSHRVRAQARTAAPVPERLERKVSTMGTVFFAHVRTHAHFNVQVYTCACTYV